MSFKDCILGKIEAGAIKPAKANALLKKFDALTNKYKAMGREEDAAAIAAEELLKGEALRIEQQQRNLRMHALKQTQLNDKFNAMPGSIEKKVRDTLQNAAWRTETVRKEAYMHLNDVVDSIKVNYSGLSRDFELVEKAVRAVLGEGTDDANAAKLAQAMEQVFDYLHARYRQAGGIVGKLDNYFPQIHRREAFIRNKTTFEDWYRDVEPLMDRSKMIDEDTGVAFEPDKLKEVMEDVFQNIVSNGRHKMAKLSKKGQAQLFGRGDLDVRRSESRFIKFKDAESFMKYNEKYGVGKQGLAQAFLEHINAMSRDIGVMEHLGPRPNAMMRFMDFKMGAEGTAPIARKWANAEYRVLTSSFQHGDTDQMWWQLFTGTQNWMRSALLGSASISAISDTSFIAATARMNGLSATGALSKYLSALRPGDSEIKQIAKRSNFIAEALGGAAIGDTRFADESMGRGFTRVLANMTNELSGLQRMTKSAQDGIALEGMATLAEKISAKTSWDSLDADLRTNLQRFDVTKADWDTLLGIDVFDNGQAKFLITSELRTHSRAAAKIADKIDDWTFMLRQMAANEQLLATRAITTGAILGDGGLATPSRVIGAGMGLFKSFPITVMLTHLLPAMRRAGFENLSWKTPFGTTPFKARKFDHLAMVLIGTTLMGAIPLQLKEMAKGKTPKDMREIRFWKAAFLQGGGMGLFGDFFFGDYSRFDRSPVTEMTGPMAGLFDDLMSSTKGNLDKQLEDIDNGKDREQHVARDLFRVFKRNIPLASLWYSRLAFERIVLDNMERLADPGFDNRINKYERKMRKQMGQEFWWRPGNLAPDALAE